MVAAVITASAGIVIALLAHILNQRSQLLFERRQARLQRINAQLKQLYGPLRALVSTNEQIWDELRRTQLPGREERRTRGPLSEKEAAEWKLWMGGVLMPINRQMRDLIIQHADLLIDSEMPMVLQTFCAHVAAYEVVMSPHVAQHALHESVLIRHPGKEFVDYILGSFQSLKEEQTQLLTLSK